MLTLLSHLRHAERGVVKLHILSAQAKNLDDERKYMLDDYGLFAMDDGMGNTATTLPGHGV